PREVHARAASPYRVISVELAQHFVVPGRPSSHPQPLVHNDQRTVSAYDPATEVDAVEFTVVVVKFTEGQRVTKNEALAGERLHVAFVDYVIALVREPRPR